MNHPIGHEATLYTYYKVEIQDMPLEWDETICESLEEVLDVLKFVDIYLDDDTVKAKVIITGIGMSREAYQQWRKDHIDEE